MVKIIKLLLFLMVLVYVYIYFQKWIRIRNPRVKDPDPTNVTDPCGSRSTTLTVISQIFRNFASIFFRGSPLCVPAVGCL
jgi:hypothetical protein